MRKVCTNMMLTETQLNKSLHLDPNNTLGKRNCHNTPTKAYNCGGFALSIYDWVCPYYRTDYDDDFKYDDDDDWDYTDVERDEIMEEDLHLGYSKEQIEEDILWRDVNFLLNQYPFLYLTKLEDCAPSDIVIAYRLFIQPDEDCSYIEDTDFHFRIRINNFWFEKMGSDDIKLCDANIEDVWTSPTAQYTSRIVYFKSDKRFNYDTINAKGIC